MNLGGLVAGTLIIAALLSLVAILCTIIGAILNGIVLYKGISNHNNQLITLSAIGLGSALLGLFVFMIVFGPISLVCGIIGFKKGKAIPQTNPAAAQAQPEVLKDAAPAEAAKPTEQEKASTEESPKGE